MSYWLTWGIVLVAVGVHVGCYMANVRRQTRFLHRATRRTPLR